MNCLIVHGKPSYDEFFSPDTSSPSNSHWLPWLQSQLVKRGINTQTPEMPRPWQPNYQEWSSVFEYFPLHNDTMLIGHSCGAGFILQWLSEHPKIKVGHVFLVAPSFGDAFFPNMEKYRYPTTGGFFEFELDSDLEKRCESITLFSSADDRERVEKTVAFVRQKMPVIAHQRFTEYGHFTTKIPDGHFHELLEAIDKSLKIAL